jgi:N-acetylglucosamine kinase-like BadF-type ATPase
MLLFFSQGFAYTEMDNMTPSQALVIAVDGGQSSTLALVATTDGKIIGSGFAGPSNHVTEVGGPERLRNAITQSIAEALSNAGGVAEQVVSLCLGMTGGAEMAYDMAQTLFPRGRLQSYYDSVTALAGASLAQPGVVVIAGTGAVAYGRLADGREAKAGGWGYIMGDEGGGYDIGRSALAAASQSADGRLESTRLLQAIPEYLGFADLKAVHAAIYGGQITRPQIARLTVPVVAAAQAGDAVARRLLESAAHQLALAALAVVNQLGIVETGLDVFPTGGVFEASPILAGAFRDYIAVHAPAVQLKMPAFPPIIGGLLLALEAASTPLTESVVETIRATFPQAAASKHQAREQSGD